MIMLSLLDYLAFSFLAGFTAVRNNIEPSNLQKIMTNLVISRSLMCVGNDIRTEYKVVRKRVDIYNCMNVDIYIE